MNSMKGPAGPFVVLWMVIAMSIYHGTRSSIPICLPARFAY